MQTKWLCHTFSVFSGNINCHRLLSPLFGVCLFMCLCMHLSSPAPRLPIRKKMPTYHVTVRAGCIPIPVVAMDVTTHNHIVKSLNVYTCILNETPVCACGTRVTFPSTLCIRPLALRNQLGCKGTIILFDAESSVMFSHLILHVAHTPICTTIQQR